MSDRNDMQAAINAIEALEDTLSGAELKIACTMIVKRYAALAARDAQAGGARAADPGEELQGWAVTVERNGVRLLAIEKECVSGVENIGDFAPLVRDCAEHLLSFIGRDSDAQAESGHLAIAPVPVPDEQTCSECGENRLFCDLKSDEEKANFFLSGRAYEAGVIARAIQNDVAMAYQRCTGYAKELAELRGKCGERQLSDEQPSLANPMTPYGMLVRALRIVAGTTLYDMAKALCTSPAVLSSMEFGRSAVTEEYAIAVAAYFDALGVPNTLASLQAALNTRALLTKGE